jgi:hypothetical protein
MGRLQFQESRQLTVKSYQSKYMFKLLAKYAETSAISADSEADLVQFGGWLGCDRGDFGEGVCRRQDCHSAVTRHKF